MRIYPYLCHNFEEKKLIDFMPNLVIVNKYQCQVPKSTICTQGFTFNLLKIISVKLPVICEIFKV